MTGIMVSVEILRRFPFFAGLDESMLSELAMAGEDLTLGKGEWLFHERDQADALYIVVEGEIQIKVTVDASNLALPSVDSLIAGDVFGWSALVDPYVYSLSAMAAKNSRLAKFDGVRLCELMARNPMAGYILMSRLVQIIGGRLDALRLRFVSLVEGDRWQSFCRPSLQPPNVN